MRVISPDEDLKNFFMSQYKTIENFGYKLYYYAEKSETI